MSGPDRNGAAAVMGAGTMGVSLVRLLASHGWTVSVIDPSGEARARCGALVREALPDARVVLHETWPHEATADLVIEAVNEDMEVKRAVLREAEARVGREALILSNTSGIPIDDIASALAHPSRFLGAHFFNPADVIPAVEVVPGSATAPEATERARGILLALGKRPAVLRTSVPGFVSNRIQHAIIRECLSLIEKGVVTPEGLDDLVRFSIGVRMAINGPLRQRDLNGLGTHLAIARYLYPDLDRRTEPSAILAELVAAGHTGARAGRGFFEWDEASVDAQARDERETIARIVALVAPPTPG